MKLLNYQISCYGVLPSVGGTNFRPKLYVYLIVSFSSSSFLSTYHPPIYFPGCSILAPRFPNTSEFDKYSPDYRVSINLNDLTSMTTIHTTYRSHIKQPLPLWDLWRTLVVCLPLEIYPSPFSIIHLLLKFTELRQVCFIITKCIKESVHFTD